ncbi:MAG: hypothetical protein KatS3mg082_3119 [Nitrospiraceae bacterium]|nr:MAG: hypothetical protein KatS3mg082_3119 [Nitrospiraceae bacterium]
MDPLQSFCPNMDCPARGHTGRGNIRIHCHKRGRLRCTVCKKTFRHRRGTPFLHVKTATDIMALTLALIAHGCPVSAIEAVFGLQRRTVRDWLRKAGQHCRGVHEHLVLQPRPLQHVEVDEVFVRRQGGRQQRRGRLVYLFSALCVSTRLWLGGFIETRRDEKAATRLARLVHRAAEMGPLLVISDGFRGYRAAFGRVFRFSVRRGRAGRPRLARWSSLVVMQQVRQHGLVHLAQGTWAQFVVLWRQVGHRVVSTSYIERLNATFRQRLAMLARRTRHVARTRETLEAGLYLLGCIYNFCHVHRRLGRTPAQALGIASEPWSVGEL